MSVPPVSEASGRAAVALAPVPVAAVSDVGTVRRRNEDAVLVPGVILGGADRGRWSGPVASGPRALVQVFDGMGAHGGGSVASVLAALVLNEASAELPRPEPENAPDEAWIGGALQRASDVVVDVGALDPRTQIMGAATAGLVVGESTLLIFHVGDCRCYVLEAGYLTLLTADHRSRDGGGGLTRSLGGTGRREVIEADFLEMDRASPRRYLLCTDGLTDALGFDAIRESLGSGSVSEAASNLLEGALKAGSDDNVTVIVADVAGSPGSVPLSPP